MTYEEYLGQTVANQARENEQVEAHRQAVLAEMKLHNAAMRDYADSLVNILTAMAELEGVEFEDDE